MLGTFVVRQDDQIAQRAASVIRSRFPVKDLVSGELGGPNDIALVGWTRQNKNGLKHGFPSNYLRLAPEKRIQRDRVPQEIRACKRVVYVQDSSGRPNEFTLAVLAMLHNLGLPITPNPTVQTSVSAQERAFA